MSSPARTMHVSTMSYTYLECLSPHKYIDFGCSAACMCCMTTQVVVALGLDIGPSHIHTHIISHNSCVVCAAKCTVASTKTKPLPKQNISHTHC